MKFEVDKETCIGCGLCVATCPEVFDFDDDGLAKANGKVQEDTLATALSAASSCPVDAIQVIEE